MPKRGKITPVERRRWLERYEKGATIDSLAKEALRTQRTVTDHLEQARRERQHEQVQIDLMREGYREHYRDLLNLAKRMAERATSPHRGVFLGTEDPEDPGERLLYVSLRKHTPGSRIWVAARSWEEGVAGIAKEMGRLEVETTNLASQNAAEFPEILVEGFAGGLSEAVSMAAQGLDPESKEYMRDQSGGNFRLRLGSFLLADRIPDESRIVEIEQKHRVILKELLAPKTADRLKSLWRDWFEAKDIIQEEATILRLRKVVPGRCDLCPAGDTGAKRPSNRRRDE